MGVIDSSYPGLDAVFLTKGAHQPGTGGFCYQEVIAQEGYRRYGESWDAGATSIVLRQTGQRINDHVGDSVRQTLKTSVVAVMNSSNADEALERRRAYKMLDAAYRSFTPAWLNFVGYQSSAATLRNATPVTNAATARSARTTLRNPLLTAKLALSSKQAIVGPATSTGYRAYQAVMETAGTAFLLASELPDEYLVRYADGYSGNIDNTTANEVFGADADGIGGFFDLLGDLAVTAFRNAVATT